MGLTLVEYAKQYANDVLRAGVIEMFAANSDILRVLPFENIAGNALRYNREGTLPGIGFRGINESYTPSTGILNPMVESLSIVGGEIDVDKFLTKTFGEERRATETNMKVKAMALAWTEAFIKGDQGSDPKSIEGLQNRITGDQLVAAGSTSGGDVLSLAKLDELIDEIDEPTHLIMNKTVRRRLTTAARDYQIGGFISFEPDEFGKRMTVYNGLPILIADKDNENNDILPYTEVGSGGGTAQCTSIYCVSIGDGKLEGIQNGDMEVEDLGILETKPAYRTRVEWYAGFAVYHGRAAGRLYGIKDGAVTA